MEANGFIDAYKPAQSQAKEEEGGQVAEHL